MFSLSSLGSLWLQFCLICSSAYKFKFSSFVGVLELHVFLHVCEFAAFQDDAAELHPGGKIRRCEWPVAEDDEMKTVGCASGERSESLGPADHPARGQPNNFAPIIKQEHHGANQFDLLGELV